MDEDEPQAMVTVKKQDPNRHSCLLNLSCVYNNPNSFCDVVLTVAGRQYHAHKVVLAVCSPVFAAMLGAGTWEEGSKAEICLDEEADCLEDFLKYIYNHDVLCESTAKKTALYALADKYQVVNLRNILALSLCEDTPVTDLAETIELMAPYANIRYLLKHQLLVRFEEIVTHGCVGGLSLDSFAEVLSSDELIVGSEMVVFQSVCQWVRDGGVRGDRTHDKDQKPAGCEAEPSRCGECNQTTRNPNLSRHHRGHHAPTLFNKVRYHLMSPNDLELVQTDPFFPFSPLSKDTLLTAYRSVCSRKADETMDQLRCKSLTLHGITKQGLRKAKFMESMKHSLFGKSWKLSCDTNGGDRDVCLKLSYEKTTVPYNIMCTLYLEAPGKVMFASFNRTTSTAGDEAHSWGYTVFCSLSELADTTWTARAVFRITPPSPEWYTRPTSVTASSPPCTTSYDPSLIVVSHNKGADPPTLSDPTDNTLIELGPGTEFDLVDYYE